jgi:hypothetical protein
MDNLVELFVPVDDFSQVFLPQFEKHLLSSGIIQRRHARSLTISVRMTILIRFHLSLYHNFLALRQS